MNHNERIREAARKARNAAVSYGPCDVLYMLFGTDGYVVDPLVINVPLQERVLEVHFTPSQPMLGNCVNRWLKARDGAEPEHATIRDGLEFIREAEMGMVKGFGATKVRRTKHDLIEAIYEVLTPEQRMKFWEKVLEDNTVE